MWRKTVWRKTKPRGRAVGLVWLTVAALIASVLAASPSSAATTLPRDYWGNANTIVPVYDTVWDLGVSARTEQVVEYSAFLADSGFSGFATTYLGSIHRPARRSDQGEVYVRPNPYGEPIATWDDATGNLVLGADHADRFEGYLDAAHAEGLRVILFVVWERKAIDEFGLINEGNAYNWAFQMGTRFGNHPAIQTWTMGGDAATDAARTNLWRNAVAGLRDAGVTGDISYGTGSAPQRRINNLQESWNSSQLVQTSHCGTPDLIDQRISGVVAQANIPVWAGEMRYEGIDAAWCDPPVGIPGGPEVVADSLAAVNAGAAGIIYGHNDRWQWGHGALGGGDQGWDSVKASFTAPGQHMVIAALDDGTPPPPDTTAPTSTIDDPGPLEPGSFTVTGTAADTESAIDRVRVRIRRDSDRTYWNGSAWVPTLSTWVNAQGREIWTVPDVPTSEGSYRIWAFAIDAAGNVQTWADARPTRTVNVVVPDLTVPDTTIDDPGLVAAGTTSITGTATDDASGVARVLVRVKRLSDNTYWDGTSWVAPVRWVDATGSDSWALDDVPVTPGTYQIRAYSTDNAGNVEDWADGRPNRSITVVDADTTPPDTTIDDPGTLAAGTWAPTGTASDDLTGVARVRVRIRRESDKNYWDGSAWVPNSVWVNAAGTASWSVPGVTVVEGDYRIWAFSIDEAGNVQTWADGRPSRRISVAP